MNKLDGYYLRKRAGEPHTYFFDELEVVDAADAHVFANIGDFDAGGTRGDLFLFGYDAGVLLQGVGNDPGIGHGSLLGIVYKVYVDGVRGIDAFKALSHRPGDGVNGDAATFQPGG